MSKRLGLFAKEHANGTRRGSKYFSMDKRIMKTARTVNPMLGTKQTI
jgi:hypothetical protein